MSYLIGQTIRLRATFRDDAGDLVSPTAVSASIISPTGKVMPQTPVELSLGIFYFDAQFSQIGKYLHHWEGRSADFEAVAEEEFRVVRDA